MHDICCLLTQARINKEYSFCFIQDSPVGQGVGMQQHLTLITGLLLGDDGNKCCLASDRHPGPLVMC